MNVRTLCLGILSFHEASGYEIKKQIEEGQFSHFIDASFGSIYPALNQLHAEGLVTARAEEQEGRPDKKVYAITEQGRAILAKGVCVIPARDKFKSEFLFAMLLQDMMPQPAIVAAIEKQIHDMREDLARIAECRLQLPAMKGGAFVAGYGEVVLNAGVIYLEEQLSNYKSLNRQAAE